MMNKMNNNNHNKNKTMMMMMLVMMTAKDSHNAEQLSPFAAQTPRLRCRSMREFGWRKCDGDLKRKRKGLGKPWYPKTLRTLNQP